MKSYSLKEAATLTGHSLGRFRYNKAKLEALGAVVTNEGWSIPENALLTLGWLNPSKPVVKKHSKVEKLTEENRALKAENTQLLTRVAELEQELDQKKSKGWFRR